MRVDWEKLKREHIKIVRSILERMDLDAIVFMASDNVRYITGEPILIEFDWFNDGNAAIVTRDAEEPYLYRLEKGFKIYPYVSSPLIAEKWVKAIIKDIGPLPNRRLGLDAPPFQILEAFRKQLPDVNFVSVFDQLMIERAIKLPEEINALKEAARVIDIGFQAGLERIRPGVRESEIYAASLHAMTEAGSEGFPGSNLCWSGEREHILMTTKKVKEGEVVTIDLCCLVEGYVGDSARCTIAGRASKDGRELYRAIYEAHKSGIDAIRPGIKASDVDARIRNTLKELGFPNYPHSSGHGIGMRFLELPWITTKEEAQELDMELKPGMVLCLEPSTWKKGCGSVELEDMILVTESGHEKLTKTPYEDKLL